MAREASFCLQATGHLFFRWPDLGQVAYTAQCGLGPGNVRASRTHQLNWPPAARTTVALLGPRGSGHMVALNLSTGAAATRDQQSGDKSRQSRESGRESLTLPLFWLLDDSGFPLTQPFLPCHPFIQMNSTLIIVIVTHYCHRSKDMKTEEEI